MPFEIGNTYTFQTDGLRQNSVGNVFIALRYGDESGYKVRPFPFQEEGNLPYEIKCKVTGLYIDNRGQSRPNLKQDLADFLVANYTENEVYTFTVAGIDSDSKGNPFYKLTDSYGLEHRSYLKGPQTLNPGDTHEFKVIKVNLDNGTLKLFDVDTLDSDSAPKAAANHDPMKVSGEFGSEDLHTEFKTSLVFAPGGRNDSASDNADKQIFAIVKELAAFMNAEGGTLYLGVDDHGNVTGINADFANLNEGTEDEYNGQYKSDTDSYSLKIQNAVKKYCGNIANSLLNFEFEKRDGDLILCKVKVVPCDRPIFIKGLFLYQRAGSQKQQLRGDEITYFIQKRIGVDIAAQLKLIAEKMEAQRSAVPAVNIQVAPVASPVVPAPVADQDEVWNVFTLYKNGGWSFQKDEVISDDIERQVVINKSKKDALLVLCYDNGHINVVNPSKVRSGKDRGKIYKNGWNVNAKLLNIFVSNASHMLAMVSQDNYGRRYVKVHRLTDFNPKETLGAQGPIAVNPTLGKVIEYKWLPIDARLFIPNLVMLKAQTSSVLGIPVDAADYINEVNYVLEAH